MTEIIFDKLPDNCKLAFIRAIMATAGVESHPKPHQLVFTIDGFPVDWEKFCEAYEVHIEHYVSKKVEERISNLVNLSKLQETVDECSKKIKENSLEFLISTGLTESQAYNIIYGRN